MNEYEQLIEAYKENDRKQDKYIKMLEYEISKLIEKKGT